MVNYIRSLRLSANRYLHLAQIPFFFILQYDTNNYVVVSNQVLSINRHPINYIFRIDSLFTCEGR